MAHRGVVGRQLERAEVRGRLLGVLDGVDLGPLARDGVGGLALDIGGVAVPGGQTQRAPGKPPLFPPPLLGWEGRDPPPPGPPLRPPGHPFLPLPTPPPPPPGF